MDGLAVARTGIDEAELVLCTGLVDDLTETPEDYADRLAAMRARNLTMICANPDLVVHRGRAALLLRRRPGAATMKSWAAR